MKTELIVTFDTTHMALWAEEVARAENIPMEVIPAPPERRARCDLALAFRPVDLDRLRAALDAAGVLYEAPEV